MEVIPAINCATKECAEQKLNEIRSMRAAWAHIDITDGSFSKTPTWHDAEVYARAEILLEVHLMVTHPELILDEWLAAGVKRVIVHVESFLGREEGVLRAISTKCKAHGAELMLSENPNTAVQELFGYAGSVDSFQFLAVAPGPSGQEFDERIIKKIEMLREKMPNVMIEVDGGINAEVAVRVRDTGANIVVAASFIFGNSDPHAAFRALQNL